MDARVADGVPGRDPGPVDDTHRHRERTSQPAAHCVDCGRADDRARARDARRHARVGHHRVVHEAPWTICSSATTRSRPRTTSRRFRSTPAAAAAKAPGVTAVGNVRTGEVLVFGESTSSRPLSIQARPQVIDDDWKEGSQAVFSQLGSNGVFVDNGVREGPRPRGGLARRGHVRRTGTRRPSSSRASSTRRPAARRSAPSRSRRRPGIGQMPAAAEPLLVREDGGWRRLTRTRLRSTRRCRRSRTQRRRRGASSSTTRSRALSSVLNILYVLLALSVIVSLFGIVNTLVLTVFERTREIGMLRAIGMTRRQVRRMIRHESVITALIGAALGIVLGSVSRPCSSREVDFLVFSFPTTQVDRLRDRRDRRRDRRGDLPGAPRGQARSARGYRVRMTPSAASASISTSE